VDGLRANRSISDDVGIHAIGYVVGIGSRSPLQQANVLLQNANIVGIVDVYEDFPKVMVVADAYTLQTTLYSLG
jgi:hypothetical protein